MKTQIVNVKEILNKESYIEIPTTVVLGLIQSVILVSIIAHSFCKSRK